MPMLCTVGPGVVDELLRRLAAGKVFGHKVPCQIARRLGGGATNTGRAARLTGVDVRAILLTGDDDERRAVETMAREEFTQPVCVPNLKQTRRSILIGDDCFTVRSPVTSQALPQYAAEIVGEADFTIVAPMTPGDHAFVLNVLGLARASVLMLSNEQLHDGDSACELSRHASLTVVNDAELQTWMGTADIEVGIRRLGLRGIKNVIVTHERGAMAVIDGESIAALAYTLNGRRSTIGAGDTFVGHLAAARVVGTDWREAIDLGLRGAARHLETGSAGTPEELTEFAAHHPRLAPRANGRSISRRTAAAATVAAVVIWLSLP